CRSTVTHSDVQIPIRTKSYATSIVITIGLFYGNDHLSACCINSRGIPVIGIPDYGRIIPYVGMIEKNVRNLRKIRMNCDPKQTPFSVRIPDFARNVEEITEMMTVIIQKYDHSLFLDSYKMAIGKRCHRCGSREGIPPGFDRHRILGLCKCAIPGQTKNKYQKKGKINVKAIKIHGKHFLVFESFQGLHRIL